MAYYNAVNDKYGSFEHFIRDGLGVDGRKKDLLREKYLEGR